TVQLSPPILAEIIARPAVLLVVLIRDQRVEHIENLRADDADAVDGKNKNKIIPTDMPNKAVLPDHPTHHIMKNAREEIDHPIAVVVAVTVVVFLEVIEVGVTDGEEFAEIHTPPHRPLDLRRSRQPRRWIDRHVTLSARYQRL